MNENELIEQIYHFGVHNLFSRDGTNGEGWGIEQNPPELAQFLVAMDALGVQSVLEIGTGYKGGLSRFLAQIVGWEVTTVDIQNYGHAFQDVKYVIMPSPDERPTFERKFDLVFIDGNHSYESASTDLKHYSPFAEKVIAFHDISGLYDSEGAAQLWKELAYTKAGNLRKGFFEAMVETQKAGIGWQIL